MIIAIDGPAASGKGTLGRKLATHYRFHHLDTGLLYRGVAARLMADGARLDDREAAHRAACDLDIADLDATRLRTAELGESASIIAAYPAVRLALLELQRDFARRAPGAVLDGRDIGSVVCPHADCKLFVTASAEERARRRAREFAAMGAGPSYEAVLADIQRRDARDGTRSNAPLVMASDAVLLDTTKLDIEAALQAAIDIVDGSANLAQG